MKKWTAVFLAMLMLFGMSAQAENTAEPTGRLVFYSAEPNYTLAYDVGEFFLGELYGLDLFTLRTNEEATLLISSATLRSNADTKAFLKEAVGGYGEGALIGEVQEKQTDAMKIESVQVQFEGITNHFYLVYEIAEADEAQELLCITVTFPTGEEDTAGAKFEALVDSINLHIVKDVYQGAGWQMTYPVGYVAPEAIYGKEGFRAPYGAGDEAYMLIAESDIAPEQIPDLLAEAMGGYDGVHTLTEPLEKVTENGTVIQWVEAELADSVNRFYAVHHSEGGKVYCITVSYSSAVSHLYGGVFEDMVNSFELTAVDE